jgi:hypothetical protein
VRGGEKDERRLGGPVERHTWYPEFGGHGTDVDDGALASSSHGRVSSATRTRGTLTLTAKAASMSSFANFRGRTHGEDGGVVDQDVHVAAAEFDGPASERSRRVSAAEIGGNEVCFAALGLDRGDDRVATRGVTATDEHVGAPIGQREGGGFADAAVTPVIRAVVPARSVVLMRSLFWIFEVFTRMSFR